MSLTGLLFPARKLQDPLVRVMLTMTAPSATTTAPPTPRPPCPPRPSASSNRDGIGAAISSPLAISSHEEHARIPVQPDTITTKIEGNFTRQHEQLGQEEDLNYSLGNQVQ
jgi:hypothetical protein